MANIKIDNDLSGIYQSLGRMMTLVDEAIVDMIMALKKRDLVLAEKVMDRDEQINAMEIKIDHDCILFIARNQPVAKDLRTVASVHKILTDLERIGDITADVCKTIITLKEFSYNEIDEDIVALAEDVRKMVGDSVRSFVNEDLKGAYDVIEYDDVIDQAYYRLKDKIVMALKKQSDTTQVNSLVTQLTIAKYMEKLADHAQNISEWIIFTVSGEYKA
jgi:phosphate transport system protein